MDWLVPVIVAAFAGGGVGGVITAFSGSRKTNAEAERTTVETFGQEWRAIITHLQESLVAVEQREQECQRTVSLLHKTVDELRLSAVAAQHVVSNLQDRVTAIETGPS